jgi:hypothetical protein
VVDLGLGALQSLRLCSGSFAPLIDDASLVQLAPQVTMHKLHVWNLARVQLLPHLVHLTALQLRGSLPGGTSAALGGLTGLQELTLQNAYGEEVVAVVQQAAGMAQLRSLRLDFLWASPRLDPTVIQLAQELTASLEQCTQLTALGACAAHMGMGVNIEVVHMPQQLPGLQCLTVRVNQLAQDGGAWLSCLTSLTSLYVRLPIDECGTSSRVLQGAFPGVVFGAAEEQEEGVSAAAGQQAAAPGCARAGSESLGSGPYLASAAAACGGVGAWQEGSPAQVLLAVQCTSAWCCTV